MRETIRLSGSSNGDVIVVQTFHGKTYLGKLVVCGSYEPPVSGRYEPEGKSSCIQEETITISDSVELREVTGPHGQVCVGISEATPLLEGEFNLSFPVDTVFAAGTPVSGIADMYLKATEAKRAHECGLILETSQHEQRMFRAPSSVTPFNMP